MATAKKPTKKTAAQKPAVKTTKTAAKKPAAKKATVKKADPKKTAAKKPAAKTTAAPKKASAKTTTKTPTKTPAKKVEKVEKPAKKTPDVFRCPISGIPVKPEKPNLSPKTIEKLKELLLEERERNLAQAAELAQEAVDMITDREAGDTQFDEESGEGDSVAVERERSLFLAAEAQEVVAQIDRALERIKNHTYGLCAPSGRRITVARLEALPWTEVCVDCKARSERRR